MTDTLAARPVTDSTDASTSVLANPANADLLTRLVGESASQFFADYYERRPLLYAADTPGRFDDLITIPRLDSRIAEIDLTEGMLMLVNARDPIQPDDYVNGNMIDRVAVARLYRAGATVVFNQLQNSDRKMADFCRRMERLFGCHVQTNLYLTPSNEQGFKTHYDNHDVFILQIAGEKKWKVYGAPATIPYRGERFDSDRDTPGETELTFTLKAGDVVYIPRGYFHDAANEHESEPSLHITVGLIVRTWADLVLEAVSEQCLENPAFRRALPPGFAEPGYDSTRLKAEFRELMQHLADSASPDNGLEHIVENFVRSREPDISGAIFENRMREDATYRASTDALFHVFGEENGVRVIGPAIEFQFGRAPITLVQRVLSGDPFILADLDHEEARDVVERLMTAGLVRPLIAS